MQGTSSCSRQWCTRDIILCEPIKCKGHHPVRGNGVQGTSSTRGQQIAKCFASVLVKRATPLLRMVGD